MTLDVLTRTAAGPVSDALGELAREIARSVVLVRSGAGGSGSGVIWDQPGLVITNHHVVSAGPLAELTVAGGRRMRARVVRRAPALDLAALEVVDDVASLPGGAQVGDSDGLRVGDLVIAVGNPMGERNAPSLGIIASAPEDILRLSITLRPGNSGGALVNARGEVVGIPHMVTGSGLALAVSTRSARRFLGGASGEPDQERDNLRWI
jgi:serine protease Do